jgi:hypothetical protein
MSIFRAPQVILFSDDIPRAVAFYTRDDAAANP